MSTDQENKIFTAAMLAIGDELLSGRTQDKNISHLAQFLTLKGIDLTEVRIVSDEYDAIIEAVNALRTKYDLVFTSGGIGPTHDDITPDAMARAFNVSIDYDPRALKLFGDYLEGRGLEMTNARKRMARIPDGAELIENSVSVAPGFILENVHVMAGVPNVFQAMVQSLADILPSGVQVISKSYDCPFGEGAIGEPLTQIQKDHPMTSIGSYPQFDGKNYSTQIVVRSRKKADLESAGKAVAELICILKKERKLIKQRQL